MRDSLSPDVRSDAEKGTQMKKIMREGVPGVVPVVSVPQPPPESHSQLSALLKTWRQMFKTSEKEYWAAVDKADHLDACQRHGEACTLNVCINQLEQAIAKAEGR